MLAIFVLGGRYAKFIQVEVKSLDEERKSRAVVGQSRCKRLPDQS
jgi:hypothetical protein